MTDKTTEEMIEEFLANGGEIEVIPPVEPENKQTIGSISKKVPQIMTLPEGELMFGRKQTKRKKVKVPDYSNINMDLIPDHLKKLLGVEDKQDENTKEEQFEADQNLGSTEASDESKK